MPSICLCFITKNSQDDILITLNSFSNVVDTCLVYDCGSIDNTLNILKNYKQGKLKHIHVITYKSSDFRGVKNKLVEASKKKAEYVLIVDVGDKLVGHINFREIDKEIYLLRYGKNKIDLLPCIIKSNSKIDINFVGRDYESIYTNSKVKYCILKSDYYILSRKMEKDDIEYLELLVKKFPNEGNIKFTLAQKYINQKKNTKAYNLFKSIVNDKTLVNLNSEQLYCCNLNIANLSINLNNDWSELENLYLDAYNICNYRLEPLYYIIRHYRINSNFDECKKYSEKFFGNSYPLKLCYQLEKDIYDYGILDEISIVAYYNGCYEKSYILSKRIIDFKKYPENQQERIVKNFKFAKDQIDKNKKNMLVYFSSETTILDRRLLKLLDDMENIFNIILVGSITHDKLLVVDEKYLSQLIIEYNFTYLVLVDNINYFVKYDYVPKKLYVILFDDCLKFTVNKDIIVKTYDKMITLKILKKAHKFICFDDYIKNGLLNKMGLNKNDVYVMKSCYNNELLLFLDENKTMSLESHLSNDNVPKYEINYSKSFKKTIDIAKKTKSKFLQDIVENCMDDLLRIISDRPEPCLEMGKICYDLGDYNSSIKYLNNGLGKNGNKNKEQFIDLIYYKAKSLIKLEKYEIAYKIIELYIKNEKIKKLIPDILLNVDVINNIYPNGKIIKIMKSQKSVINERIVFSLINYNDFEGLKRTLNSFIFHCKDVNLINRWICISVGCSNEHLDKIHNLYPFLIIISQEELKYCQIVNTVRNNLSNNIELLINMGTMYQFIDDFSIELISNILSNDKSIGYVPFNDHLINENKGVYRDYTIIENYEPKYNNFSVDNVNNRFFKGYVLSYMQLKPSIFSLKCIKKVGTFIQSKNTDFEFMKEYIECGFKVISFKWINNLFMGELKRYIDDSLPRIKMLLINEDRDKWMWFKNFCSNNNMELVKEKLVDNIQLKELKNRFEGNNFNYRSDIAKYWLTIINIFKHIENNLIVLCDKTKILPNFRKKIEILYKNLKELDYDFVVLDGGIIQNKEFDIIPIKTDKIDNTTINGFIVSKVGAKKLLIHSSKNQITCQFGDYLSGIDNMKIYKTNVSLIEKTPAFKNLVINLEGYDFYSNLDSIGFDIKYHGEIPLTELKQICDKDENCMGFNTLGYTKFKIRPIKELNYLYNGNRIRQGIYVKNMNKFLEDKIKLLVNNKKVNKSESDLTFTVTTCKRLSTFKQTMDTFLTLCKDVELIDRWICIDDNSSENDRKFMKKNYPFFDFIMKTPEQKGHAKSMNMIWDNVKTNYVIHFEDDWLCNYTFRLKPFLDYIKDNTVNQLILRKICWDDHDFLCNVGEKQVFNYIYNPINKQKPSLNRMFDKEQKYNFKTKFTDNLKYWWWPGFTLNPSIFNISLLRNKIGYFNENILQELFEYDYASRCYLKGVKINYVNLNIEHIGYVSSYSLNDMRRYYDK